MTDGVGVSLRTRQEPVKQLWSALLPPREAATRPVKVQFNNRMGRKPIHGEDSAGLFGQITLAAEAIQHTQGIGGGAVA